MSGLRRVLIVGAGSIGERHLRCFAATSRAIVSLCELNSPLRATIAERYGVTASFEDYAAALAERPDIVVICTPAQTHVAMSLARRRGGLLRFRLALDLRFGLVEQDFGDSQVRAAFLRFVGLKLTDELRGLVECLPGFFGMLVLMLS